MIIGCLTANPSCRFYEKEGGLNRHTHQHAVGGKDYAESVFFVLTYNDAILREQSCTKEPNRSKTC
jgi:hypothetical protein